MLGPNTEASSAVAVPKLDRAADILPIGEVRNGKIYYTVKEQLRQQRVLEAIEEAFTATNAKVDDNTAILARLTAAEELAQAANDNAAAVSIADALKSSYPSPAGILSASSDGTITIAAHARIYGDGVSVSVDAGTVTGVATGGSQSVYYPDAAREGGVVAYEATPDNVAQSGNIHVLGRIAIPFLGEPPSSGSTVPAPGVIDPDDAELYKSFNPLP